MERKPPRRTRERILELSLELFPFLELSPFLSPFLELSPFMELSLSPSPSFLELSSFPPSLSPFLELSPSPSFLEPMTLLRLKFL